MYTWYVYVKYVYLVCIREICILGMYTWNMRTCYKYVVYVHLLWIRCICIQNMNTWYMDYVDTWYEYLKYVHLIWIREVSIHGTSTWSMYAWHEYVKYVFMVWILGICTVEMDNCRLWYMLINMRIPYMRKDDETWNRCPWDTRIDIGMTWGSCSIWQTEKEGTWNVWFCICICIRHNGAVNCWF